MGPRDWPLVPRGCLRVRRHHEPLDLRVRPRRPAPGAAHPIDLIHIDWIHIDLIGQRRVEHGPGGARAPPPPPSRPLPFRDLASLNFVFAEVYERDFYGW